MLRPMTVSGRSRATRGSWAVPGGPGVEGDADAGADKPAGVLALAVDDRGGGGGTHVEDDHRRGIPVKGGDRPRHQVGPQLGRVVNPDVESRLHPGADQPAAYGR